MTAIIRMALLGGGGGTIDGKAISWRDTDAEPFIERYIHPLTLMERWGFAMAILGARVEGVSAPVEGGEPAAADHG